MLIEEKRAGEYRCTPALVVWAASAETRDAAQAAGADVHTNCIGSRCAQWRQSWDDLAHNEAARKSVGQLRDVRGFCGLAGQP